MNRPKKLLAANRHDGRRCRCGKKLLDLSLGLTNFCSDDCRNFYTEIDAKMLQIHDQQERRAGGFR